jgi:hypothetical protein
MKKHTTDHTGRSSMRFATLDRARRGYSLRGASATHPTAVSLSYASNPGATLLVSTIE